MRSTARLSARSVLVVEDEPLIALGLKELFEDEGAKVDIACTPKDALRLVNEVAFSAGVLDFGSAGDVKAPLCGALRARAIPFIYYTGYADLDHTTHIKARKQRDIDHGNSATS
jgi:DNA-binding response OmpR family regulator